MVAISHYMACEAKVSVANVIKKTSVVTDLWFQGCRPNPQMLIKGFNIAAPKAFFTLLSPNWKTLTKKITGRSWLCGIKSVLQGADEADALYAGLSEAVFTSLEWIDAAAFYFWVAGVGIDFLINWTSLVYEMSGCKDLDGWGLMTVDLEQAFLGPFDWTTVEPYTHYEGNDIFNGGDGFFLPQGSHYSLSFRVECHQWLGFNPVAVLEARIVNEFGVALAHSVGQPDSSKAGSTGVMTFFAMNGDIPGGSYAFLQIRNTTLNWGQVGYCEMYLQNSVYNDYRPYRVKPSNC